LNKQKLFKLTFNYILTGKMKKLFLHIILISYTALLFKPVMPYVNDFISHAFFYAKHMATVHMENGQYHVHFEAAENSKQEKNEGSNTPSPPKKIIP
jgi:hypothetical protein